MRSRSCPVVRWREIMSRVSFRLVPICSGPGWSWRLPGDLPGGTLSRTRWNRHYEVFVRQDPRWLILQLCHPRFVIKLERAPRLNSTGRRLPKVVQQHQVAFPGRGDVHHRPTPIPRYHETARNGIPCNPKGEPSHSHSSLI